MAIDDHSEDSEKNIELQEINLKDNETTTQTTTQTTTEQETNNQTKEKEKERETEKGNEDNSDEEYEATEVKPKRKQQQQEEEEEEEEEEKTSEIFQRHIGKVKVAGQYVANSTKKDKRGFCVGILTIFLVVMFITILQGAIGISPIIFLKLAENQVGDFDLSLANDLGFTINYTQLGSVINSSPDVSGSSPRWMLLGELTNAKETIFMENLNTTVSASAFLFAIDNEREKAMGVGREWNHPTLGNREVHVSSTVLRRLNIRPNVGDVATLTIDIPGLISQAGGANFSLSDAVSSLILSQLNSNFASLVPSTVVSNFIDTFILPNLIFKANFTVRDSIDGGNGKYPSLLGNVAILESRFLSELLASFANQFTDNLANGWDSFIANNFTNVNPFDLLNQTINNAGIGNIVFQTNMTVEQALEQIPQLNFTVGNTTIDIKQFINATALGFNISLSNLTINQALLLANSSATVPSEVTLNDILIIVAPALNATLPVLNLSSSVIFPGLRSAVEAIAKNFRIDDFAMSVIVNNNKHFDLYKGTANSVKKKVFDFANQITDTVGSLAKLKPTAALFTAMQTFEFIKLFLNQIMLMITIIFIFLGSLLIYSLLLSDVEAKTYEYGMLRALGMRNYVLMELIGIQSLSFSLPGIGLGLLVGYCIFLIVSSFITKFALSPFIANLDSTTLILATMIGFFIPFFANIFPIMRALTKTLRDALDIYHQVQAEVIVQITRLKDMGISVWLFLISAMVVVIGFVTYYLIPVSFIFSNFSMFFTIMCLILLMTLAGLTTISFAVEPLLERLFSIVLVWGKEREAMRQLVRKNLVGHKRRNFKTAVMLTVSIAFIIFAGASFALMGSFISDLISMLMGSDVIVWAVNSKIPVNEAAMRSWLEIEVQQPHTHVASYSFVTYDLKSSNEIFNKVTMSNLAQVPKVRTSVIGVERNFLRTANTHFYEVGETCSQFSYASLGTNKPDIVQSLYDDKGKQRLSFEEKGISIPPDIGSVLVGEYNASYTSSESYRVYTDYIDLIVSSGFEKQVSTDTKTPMWIRVSYADNANSGEERQAFYLGKIRASAGLMPGFTFSKYSSMSMLGSNVLVSMDQYKAIQKAALEDIHGSGYNYTEPDKEKLLVKMKEGSTRSDRELVLNSLKNFVNDDITQVLDVPTLIETASSSLSMLNLFFIVVAVIAIVLCFFVLWLSFTANVKENSWEFAVLRSIGLKARNAALVFVYEALCLVLSCIILGTLSGICVALLFVSQMLMFTGLPFSFNFPSLLFAITVSMSVVVAIIGSVIPARFISNKPIGIVLKGE
eukprot:TRINITY_DN26_c0_g1_i5.p1 TRINITY_DN26_c0_g1~~TRINITY_DN26_c0_g1_i5.p1  ORF type:complete len:1436 (-),score=485.84 TRINITY_DN26_c0_g1_i5:6-3914(-)